MATGEDRGTGERSLMLHRLPAACHQPFCQNGVVLIDGPEKVDNLPSSKSLGCIKGRKTGTGSISAGSMLGRIILSGWGSRSGPKRGGRNADLMKKNLL